jgi:hypothetical protein
LNAAYNTYNITKNMNLKVADFIPLKKTLVCVQAVWKEQGLLSSQDKLDL